jgi:hypothetical protein
MGMGMVAVWCGAVGECGVGVGGERWWVCFDILCVAGEGAGVDFFVERDADVEEGVEWDVRDGGVGAEIRVVEIEEVEECFWRREMGVSMLFTEEDVFVLMCGMDLMEEEEKKVLYSRLVRHVPITTGLDIDHFT